MSGAFVTRSEFERVTQELELLRYRLEWLFVDGEILAPDLEALKLTKSERIVLRLLATRPGRFVSRELMMQACYGGDPEADWPTDKVIDIFVSRLRVKLAAAKLSWFIEAAYGLGYKLVPPATVKAPKR